VNRVALWILVSAAAAVFFGLQAYRAWTEPVLPGEEARAGETLSRPAPAIPPGGPGDAVYSGLSSIIARPVFRPDRRPFQEESAADPQKNYEAELARYTVLGVLMAGDDKKAVVVATGGGPGERWEVGAGDSLAGFTVKEVGEDGLILTAEDREFTLPLYAGGPKAVGRTPLRTEVAPIPSPAPSQPRVGVRTAPGRGQPSPPAVSSPSPAPQPSNVAPSRSPQRTYPRRYIPGRR
jgi:hypothetical protein